MEPSETSKCDLQECRRAASTRLEVVYAFPTWLLGRILHSFIEVSISGSLTFMLTAKRRLPFEAANILWLTQFGNVETLRSALESDKTCVLDVHMSGGMSALQLAILGQEDKINKIKLLLQSGANPDQEDDTGNTARTTAAREIMMRTQPANILRELEILFPPSSCIDDFNFTLLHKVILGICPINLSSLVEGRDSLILAQLDAEDQFGITPIQYAAQRDDLSAVQALITAGAKTGA
ncbi:hypothetical protein V8E51_005293 [Hyaloscypha variabilis]